MQDKDKLTRQTIHELARVANQFARSENLPIEIDENTSITTREAHMIQAIGDTPDATVTEMAARFGVSKSAASQLIERLREKGYVEKAPAPCSNKELRLTLTPTGWDGYRAHERVHGKDMERLCRCVGAFPADQIEILSQLLRSVGDILEKRLTD